MQFHYKVILLPLPDYNRIRNHQCTHTHPLLQYLNFTTAACSGFEAAGIGGGGR